MRPSIRLALPAAAVLLAAAAPRHAAAQGRPAQPWERRPTPTLSIEGGGLYSSFGSRGEGPLGDGFGFDVQGNVGVSALSLGVGYQRSEQHVSGATEKAVYDGFYVEPRISLAIAYGAFTPYVAGRVGRLDVTVPGAAESQRATLYGGGAGLLVALAPNVQLNLAGMWSYVKVSDDGVGSGHGALLRAGLVLGAGNWGR